jgi:hypothetical protein
MMDEDQGASDVQDRGKGIEDVAADLALVGSGDLCRNDDLTDHLMGMGMKFVSWNKTDDQEFRRLADY